MMCIAWSIHHLKETCLKKKQNAINRIFNVFNVECENYFTCETECLIYIFKGFLTRENIENSCATHERSSISNVKALNILYASSEYHGRNNTRVCSTRFIFSASCSL